MLFLKEDELLMLQSAGYVPCLVKDLRDGDTVMIDHSVDREYGEGSKPQMPTEMTVSGMESDTINDDGSPRVLLSWVGTLTRNGLKVHCRYHNRYECWKLAQPAIEVVEG
jgi:hypothetical protein